MNPRRKKEIPLQEALLCFAHEAGERYLGYLEEHFEVDLPVFQGALGRYDALDAMRRDAYREVFLLVRRHLKEATEGQSFRSKERQSLAQMGAKQESEELF